MQHDLNDFLRPSPYPVIEYYLRKAELAPVPSDSHILNDPGVRIYASIITRICLCFKYWDADWRDTVPEIHGRDVDLKTAYRTTLSALLKRIAAVKAEAAGGRPVTEISTMLRLRRPHIEPAIRRSSYDSITPDDFKSLVRAAKTDLGRAGLKKGIKYFVDKALAHNPPPGIRLKDLNQDVNPNAGDTSVELAADTSADLGASTSANALEEKPTFPTPSTSAAPSTVSTSALPTSGSDAHDALIARLPAQRQERLAKKAQRQERLAKKAKANRNRILALTSRGIPATMFTPTPAYQVQVYRPAGEEWLCENCGYTNTSTVAAAGVKKETSSAAATTEGKKDPDADDSSTTGKSEERCVSCEVVRPKTSDSEATEKDREAEAEPQADTINICPDCQDLLPEGVVRDKTYSAKDLKEHVHKWHSDYAFAAMWRDRQKMTLMGSVVWACPSKGCPWIHFRSATDLESHLVSNHAWRVDSRIPARHLYAMASHSWANQTAQQRQYSISCLEMLEQRMIKEEEEALAQLIKDWDEFALAEVKLMEAEDANKKDTEHNEGVADDAMDVDRVLKSAGEEEVAREPMAVDAC